MVRQGAQRVSAMRHVEDRGPNLDCRGCQRVAPSPGASPGEGVPEEALDIFEPPGQAVALGAQPSAGHQRHMPGPPDGLAAPQLLGQTPPASRLDGAPLRARGDVIAAAISCAATPEVLLAIVELAA